MLRRFEPAAQTLPRHFRNLPARRLLVELAGRAKTPASGRGYRAHYGVVFGGLCYGALLTLQLF
jgi:hypothetical protein